MVPPRWLEPLRTDPDLRANFNEWVTEAITVYANKALTAADSMDVLKGLRYAAGELEALRFYVNNHVEEFERESNVTSRYPGA